MNIVCRLNKTEPFEIQQVATYIDFFDSNSFSYTFWDNRNKLPYWYSQQSLDLLYIYYWVYLQQIDYV